MRNLFAVSSSSSSDESSYEPRRAIPVDFVSDSSSFRFCPKLVEEEGGFLLGTEMDDEGGKSGALKTPVASTVLVLLALGAGNTGADMAPLGTTSDESDKVDDEVDG